MKYKQQLLDSAVMIFQKKKKIATGLDVVEFNSGDFGAITIVCACFVSLINELWLNFCV